MPVFTRTLVPLGLVLVIVAAFAPALNAGFVNWDDPGNFLENPEFRGLGPAQWQWMFTTLHAGLYQPLTWVTLGATFLIHGLDPCGYHLGNLVLHIATAMMMYLVARRLLRAGFSAGGDHAATAMGAALAAALFAVHPLRVESVAWASERRDPLSGLFFALCVLTYLRYAECADPRRRRVRLALSVGCFVAALLSKATTVVLPAVLLVVDVYPLRRFGPARGGWFRGSARRVWIEKRWYAIPALIVAVAALIAQHRVGAAVPLERWGALDRLATAVHSAAFYVEKTVWPAALGPMYQLPEADDIWRALPRSLLVVGGITLAALILRRRFPEFIAAWIVYGLMILPVSGIIQVGRQAFADRYSYLACMPFAVLAGAAAASVWRQRSRRGMRMVTWCIGGAIVVTLAALTNVQTRHWHDSESLWRRALAVGQDNAVVHCNLGLALAERHEFEAARAQYETALRFEPTDVKALNGLAIAQIRTGAPDQALTNLRRALEIDADYANAHFNIGYVLAGYGRLREAAEHYRRAAQLQPRRAEAFHRLAEVLTAKARYANAAEALRDGLAEHPQHREMTATLAWLLATCPDETVRDGAEAYRLASRLVETMPEPNPRLLDAFAAACAADGRYDEAVAAADRAIRIAAGRGAHELASSISERLLAYQRGEPFIDDSDGR